MWITTGQKEKKSKPKAFPADKMIPTVHVISIVMPISRFCFKTIVQLSLDLKQSYNRFSLHRFGGALESTLLKSKISEIVNDISKPRWTRSL